MEAPSWSNPLALVNAGTTDWVDKDVTIGTPYEYQVHEQTQNDHLNYGYLYAGIEVPMIENRGKVLLLVDSTFGRSLANEIARLEQDLTGDGWAVARHYVARTASPKDIRILIKSEYDADPANLNAVFLLGHVPVPYSGDLNPDLHLNHLGAWPADAFYGDMDGNWTDSTVSSTSSEDSRNYNVPGDGKFDQSFLPSPVELQVGRVDLSDLPAFLPKTERDLLRQYLDKNHNFRHKVFSLSRRALVHDNFGEIGMDAPAIDAWRNFAPLLGAENIREIPSYQFFPTLAAEGYLWSYGGGGGSYDHIDGVGYTGDFAHTDTQTVFTILHGSYLGDWDTPDNFSRAPLASAGYTLACAWAGLPHWFFQHMALGETIGFSTRVTQNFGGKLYVDEVNDEAGKVHIALMGDPTLRMHPVGPVANLTGIARGSQLVTLNWTPSSDAVLGYHVYRAANRSGPFARLTSSLVTSAAFTDRTAPLGANVYMVRAVKLEITPSGSYYNPSQGIFVTVNVQVKPSPPSASIQYTNGLLTLRLNGPPGEAYRIQTTTDLQNWSEFEDGIVGDDGVVERSLNPKPSEGQCIYRILWF